MSSYTNALVVKWRSADLWEVIYPFSFYIGNARAGRIVAVPSGFVTDLASIPSALRVIIPKRGKWDSAACLHDFCYLNRPKISGHKRNRKYYDDLFMEAMKVSGVGKITRCTMYRAVRMFGDGPWNRYRDE